MFFIVHHDAGYGSQSTLVIEAPPSFEAWFADVFLPWAKKHEAPETFAFICKAEHVEMVDEFSSTTAAEFWGNYSGNLAIERGTDVIPGPPEK